MYSVKPLSHDQCMRDEDHISGGKLPNVSFSNVASTSSVLQFKKKGGDDVSKPGYVEPIFRCCYFSGMLGNRTAKFLVYLY